MGSDVLKESLERIFDESIHSKDLTKVSAEKLSHPYNGVDMHRFNYDDKNGIWINDDYLLLCAKLKQESRILEERCKQMAAADYVAKIEIEDKPDTKQCKRSRRVRLSNGMSIYVDSEIPYSQDEESNIIDDPIDRYVLNVAPQFLIIKVFNIF